MLSLEAGPYLIQKACSSIQYRLLRRMGRPARVVEMRMLQDAILCEPRVQEVLSWQGDDGWLAEDFHGARSMETGIRVLCEMGVERGNPALARALEALEAAGDRLYIGIGKPGAILDELGLGGSKTIRATVFAYAGIEDRAETQEQIGLALGCFRAALDARHIDQIAEPYKGGLVFRPGAVWPSIYHLRLLAFTHGWRTPENTAMLARAARKLIGWAPIPDIKARRGSQLIAPASFALHDFGLPGPLDPAGWMFWFHRMELMARLGIIRLVPELAAQVRQMETMLDPGGRFTLRVNHPYFKDWGAYTGLMLERDWKAPERRITDLTFRSVIIRAGAVG